MGGLLRTQIADKADFIEFPCLDRLSDRTYPILLSAFGRADIGKAYPARKNPIHALSDTRNVMTMQGILRACQVQERRDGSKITVGNPMILEI